MVLQQPTWQEHGHVALPGQQGPIGPEGNDSCHNNHPAPVYEETTKPICQKSQKKPNLLQKIYNFFGLPQKVTAQQWTVQTGEVSDSNMTVSR